MILAKGRPAHAVWLDFHEQYAGYIEPTGPREIAIWGLARSAHASPTPTWLPPDSVIIIPPEHRFTEAIYCADVHPVHGCELGADGSYRGLGGPALTFDMAIERHGVLKDFYGRGKVTRTLLTRNVNEPQHQELLHSMAQALVPEASDRATHYYLESHRLLRFCPLANQLELFECGL